MAEEMYRIKAVTVKWNYSVRLLGKTQL